MADGLWDCDSNVEVGLAQRADEDPDGLVQSSDMFALGCVYMYVSSSLQTGGFSRRQMKTREEF